MIRDTADMFAPQDRGRFGDNEQSQLRGRVSSESAADADRYVELLLYRHKQTDDAVRLSPNGRRTHAKWIPKRYVEQPATTEYAHPSGGGERCERGRFRIARWKAQQLSWDQLADDKQMGLL